MPAAEPAGQPGVYGYTVVRMDTHRAFISDTDDTAAAVYSGTERLLLHLILAAGYAFLGFFGWLLTL